MSEAFKILRLVACWVLAVALLLSGSSGMVLCVADDGHVALEPAHQGSCGQPGNRDDEAHDDAALLVIGCSAGNTAGCVDVALGLGNMAHVVKDVRHARLLKYGISKDLSADYVALKLADDHRTLRLACGVTPRLSQSLVAQRTIVLRI